MPGNQINGAQRAEFEKNAIPDNNPRHIRKKSSVQADAAMLVSSPAFYDVDPPMNDNHAQGINAPFNSPSSSYGGSTRTIVSPQSRQRTPSDTVSRDEPNLPMGFLHATQLYPLTESHLNHASDTLPASRVLAQTKNTMTAKEIQRFKDNQKFERQIAEGKLKIGSVLRASSSKANK